MDWGQHFGEIALEWEIYAKKLEVKLAIAKESLETIASFDDKNYNANSEYDKGLGAAYAALGSIANKSLTKLNKDESQ